MTLEIIEQIKNDKSKGNIIEGTPLEIILSERAKYSDGLHWRSFFNGRKYLPVIGKIYPKSHIRVLGYFTNVNEKGIFVEDHMGELFIDEQVIHSYSKIKRE